jgi:hypothetical protein
MGKEISRHSRSSLSCIKYKTNAKQMWHAVRKLAGDLQNAEVETGISADAHNHHYAAPSSDQMMSWRPAFKLTVMLNGCKTISERLY